VNQFKILNFFDLGYRLDSVVVAVEAQITLLVLLEQVER